MTRATALLAILACLALFSVLYDGGATTRRTHHGERADETAERAASSAPPRSGVLPGFVEPTRIRVLVDGEPEVPDGFLVSGAVVVRTGTPGEATYLSTDCGAGTPYDAPNLTFVYADEADGQVTTVHMRSSIRLRVDVRGRGPRLWLQRRPPSDAPKWAPERLEFNDSFERSVPNGVYRIWSQGVVVDERDLTGDTTWVVDRTQWPETLVSVGIGDLNAEDPDVAVIDPQGTTITRLTPKRRRYGRLFFVLHYAAGTAVTLRMTHRYCRPLTETVPAGSSREFTLRRRLAIRFEVSRPQDVRVTIDGKRHSWAWDSERVGHLVFLRDIGRYEVEVSAIDGRFKDTIDVAEDGIDLGLLELER